VPFSEFDVREVFGEVRIPIVQDAPWAKLLQLTAAARYSDYSTAGSTWTYEAAAEWQPIDDFRVRGSYQRAVRAPNVLELFGPQNVVLFGGQDPCAAGQTSAAVLANCASSHTNPDADVPNAGSGVLTCPAAQCNQAIGGNVDLRPETSDTLSAGIVLTPTFIPGFSATIDYFHIKVTTVIGFAGAQFTANQCYVDDIEEACNKIKRSALHQIWGAGWVENFNTNTGLLATSGWDFEANYQTDLADWDLGNNGSLAFAFNGTWLDTLKVQPLSNAPETRYDCAGLFGVICGTPNPEWRHKLRVTWSSPWDVDLSTQWRHIASVDLDINTSDVNLGGGPGGGANDQADATIDSFNYFDLTAIWHVWENVELRAGVNNIFDKSPPFVDSNTFGISSPPFGNGNTFPGVYDALGRTVFVGGTVKL
jgi:outer membrane receptor protein involved in Fe transport